MTWTKQTIQNLHQQLDKTIELTTITCSKTGNSIFALDESGNIKRLRSHGECTECNTIYHADALHTHHREHDRWPIIYVGLMCNDCWTNWVDPVLTSF
jgi:hypothetical protein